MMKSYDELTGRARERPQEEAVVKSRFKVTKANEEKMQAFGWANVSIDEAGNQLEDWQGDMIDPEDLEQAAYQFVRFYRQSGEMHYAGEPKTAGTLIESVVFTEEKLKAMGVPEGTLPIGWWIGFQVLDPEVWEKVKDGTYSMFSIEGTAERIDIPEDPDE